MGRKMRKEDKIDRLLDYLRGRLEEREAKKVERELERDPEMKESLILLKELGAESRSVDWNEIDATVRAISSRMVDDYFKKGPGGKQAPGVLIYDSKLLPLPAGVRPASVDVRRLKFRIEEMELMVSLYPVAPKAYELMGQLSGYNRRESIEISLVKGTKKYRTEPDSFQLFHFSRVPSGDYRMLITAGDDTIADLNIDV
jgi:hypothetical protein